MSLGNQVKAFTLRKSHWSHNMEELAGGWNFHPSRNLNCVITDINTISKQLYDEELSTDFGQDALCGVITMCIQPKLLRFTCITEYVIYW